MTHWEIVEHIAKASESYGTDEFELYCAEAGWEDWMADYTEAAEDESPSEGELRAIGKLQYEGFKESHPDVEAAIKYGIF